MAVLLIRKEVFYILEVFRGRLPFDTLKQKVMEVKRRYGSSALLIEDSPISRGLIQSLREQSINVTTYKPDTDKRARVIAQSDLFAGGSVRFPRRAEWLEDFTAELLAFPGRHDDSTAYRADRRRDPAPIDKRCTGLPSADHWGGLGGGVSLARDACRI